MSAVSRSEYQKKCEEVKRLKADIKSLIGFNGFEEEDRVWNKWADHFFKEQKFNNAIKALIRGVEKMTGEKAESVHIHRKTK